MTPAELQGLGAVFDHAAVAAPRLRDLLPVYHDMLGGRLHQGGDNQRVGYRAVQLAYPDGTRIELMEPLAGSTFFDSFFRRGGGLHHVTFKVPDMDAAVEALRQRGYGLTGLYRGDPAWEEVFLHPREAHGVLLQLAHEGAPYPQPEGLTLEGLLAGRGQDGNGVPSP